jgi:hypothetical protein
MSSLHFFYPRHFMLLAGFSVVVAVMTRLHLLTDLNFCFAVYGALHASALVLAIRAGQSLWRRCLFVAIAAALSVMALRIGLLGGHVSGTLPGAAALYVVLGVSAAIGALAYGILIRLFGLVELTVSGLGLIAAGCMLAAFVAFFTLAHSHFLGRWWLAVLWWYAFSSGLWFCDRRPGLGKIPLEEIRSPSAATSVENDANY